MKKLLKSIDCISNVRQGWDAMQDRDIFHMRNMYTLLRSEGPKVPWCKLLRENVARPRAVMIMWLACHGRLATTLWDGELDWLIHHTKGKGWRFSLLKLAATKKLYDMWKYRKDTSYDNNVDNTKIAENTLDVIVYMGWYRGSLINHIAKLMMF
ncbi:hypothetical protein KIW84_057942 [Lathyrus oleraceus]|uniref:Reverse transcriptase zinc-binding domain-containing protein n=1 Tax=Pisum sativum TaxID=3888 RepID=A0A9D4X3K1_PEA|nr:hypothetical protein KIW84_057942 [Pisum sativum]